MRRVPATPRICPPSPAWPMILLLCALPTACTDTVVVASYVASAGYSDSDSLLRFSFDGISWDTYDYTVTGYSDEVYGLASGEGHILAVGNGASTP